MSISGLPDRRRQADPLKFPAGQPRDPLEDREQVPAAVVAGEGMDLVHDHHPQVREQAAGIDVGRDEHQLQRLGRREQAVGRVAENVPPGSRGHVAVPEGRSPAQERAVPLEPKVEVVEQGLDRADVEHAQARPALGEHAGGDGQEGRLGLAACRRAPARSCAARPGCRGSPPPGTAATAANPGC